jgi:tRNA pseudouridine13 synthase
MSLAYAHGGPPLQGIAKLELEDFVVEESLGFVADGLGEHDLLWIEKRGANTEWVARGLARHAKVAGVAVGFAGLKDRQGVTRQHFSVQLPGRQVDWSTLAIPGVSVLGVARHSRKLKRGGLTGNRFVLRLRQLRGDRDAADARLAQLQVAGAPNYFGEQRFGREGGNLDLARRLFAGAHLGRSERGFALSAARSAIFNAILDRRVRDGSWNRPIAGDLMNLAGRRAFFGPITVDEVLIQRCQEGDIHPTGALWGQGMPSSAGDCAALESDVATQFADLADGLAAAGMEHDRRPLRVRVDGLAWTWLASDELELAFTLPAGAYATAFVRELVQLSDGAAGMLETTGADPTD